MSPLFARAKSREHYAPADRLNLWADELDRVADRFCEQLDYEGYTGLSEHSAELRAVASMLEAKCRGAHVAQLVEGVRDHLRYIEEDFGEEVTP